ncbi:hypothetical protein [Streptomyces sp. NPDC005898]|uniref:hypothetical protein n=1 Tax=Streptomyces sp. NPDC005898 TaxID=3157082 RepID=UPI0033D372C9
MATDAYTGLRPRLARILRRGESDNGMPEFDRIRTGLADAAARGDETVRQALEEELRGHVRQLLQSDPAAGWELASLVRDERNGTVVTAPVPGAVTFSNNTINGPVLGSGTQHNTL